jgi:hypothetical protein
MKYKFYEYTRNDPWRPNDNYKRPVVEIDDVLNYGEFFGAEINNLSSNLDYIKEIVSKLKAVLDGKIKFYEGFGYEVYMIECDKEKAVVKNIFEDDKVDAIIPTQEVYELMRDWKNYLLDYSSSLKVNEDKKISEEISANYTFFDGLKKHSVTNQYNNWLSSTDFSIWSNSYIEVNNKKIYIIKDNVKTLSTFSHFTKENLKLLAEQYELEIKEENGVYYAYTSTHDSRQLEISKNEDLTVIYAIEGDRAPESIFIYGVFENE